MSIPVDTAQLLAGLDQPGREALDVLLPQLYEQLHDLAHRQLLREHSGHTLNTTALVHEAYVRLSEQERVRWQSRAHFLGVAALVMRRLLVNHAVRRRTARRGGGAAPVTWTEGLVVAEGRAEELLALDEALTRLAELDPRQARMVECRFFGGLTDAEIAESLGVSVPTVQRDWRAARAWLAVALDVESEK
ncbi:MAG TPA: ECF-type sigma factor [Longimicrobiales bacterium]